MLSFRCAYLHAEILKKGEKQMISVEVDTMGSERVYPKADFTPILGNTSDFQEFSFECGLELKAAVLAVIVAAQDEFVRVMKWGMPQMDAEQKSMLKKTLLSFISDINPNEIAAFRKETGM